MKLKVKKLIIPAVLVGGALLLVCGGVIGTLVVGAAPQVWDWTKRNAGALLSLHPDAAEFVQSLRTLNPDLRSALSSMGQVTLEPEALLAQLAASAVPVEALDGLSPAEMNAQLAAWGVPLRVSEPGAGTASRPATAAAATETEAEEAAEDASEP